MLPGGLSVCTTNMCEHKESTQCDIYPSLFSGYVVNSILFWKPASIPYDFEDMLRSLVEV